jgi:hypothetical protein
MHEFRDKWIAIGLSTEPANRREAEVAVVKSYALVGLPTPKIVWCDSPLSQGLTYAILTSQKLTVRDSVRDSVRALVRASVWDSVRASVWDSVRASVWDSVGDSVWDSVRASVLDSVGALVRASVLDSVGALVRDSVWDSVRDSVRASVYGQHDAGWLSFYDYFSEVVGLTNQIETLQGLIALAKHAGWALPCRNTCWVSERHTTLNRDDAGRLHSEDSPAVGYPDGWSIYAWHGVRVPKRVITSPESLTTQEINTEANAEIRRVMLERFGYQRYLLESGAKRIAVDELGELYRTEVPDDEPLVMVKVKNSTPEPDGSFKDYWLRVPPGIQKARDAVAWTFGYQNGREYAAALVKET